MGLICIFVVTALLALGSSSVLAQTPPYNPPTDMAAGVDAVQPQLLLGARILGASRTIGSGSRLEFTPPAAGTKLDYACSNGTRGTFEIEKVTRTRMYGSWHSGNKLSYHDSSPKFFLAGLSVYDRKWDGRETNYYFDPAELSKLLERGFFDGTPGEARAQVRIQQANGGSGTYELKVESAHVLHLDDVGELDVVLAKVIFTNANKWWRRTTQYYSPACRAPVYFIHERADEATYHCALQSPCPMATASSAQ